MDVEITSPASLADLEASLDGGRLQCSHALSVNDCAVVDAFLARHPRQCLRIHGGAVRDLGFLAHLPSLRDAWIDADAGDLPDLDALGHLPNELEALVLDTLARFSDPKLDKPKTGTQQLTRFKEMRTLTLCSRLRDLGFLAGLPSLAWLALWRNGLKDLGGIEACGGLADLVLRASGAKSVAPLRALARLRSLEIWDQRGLTDLQALAGLPALARLWIVSCGRDLALPSFAGFEALRVLVLHTGGNAAGLERIAEAPGLRCLVLGNEPALNAVEALRPLAGHPTLQEVRIDSPSEALRAAISEAYGWKVQYANWPADEYLA